MTGVDPPYVFGVRHLSPGASFHLNRFLEQVKPDLVLVEGPSDASPWIEHIVAPGSKPPLAVLAYTTDSPVRSLIVPFADYSPEYQALSWARRNRAEARFIDLPSGVFLALQENNAQKDATEPSGEEREDFYEQWARAAGVHDYESWWEDAFEHNRQPDSYQKAAIAFGSSLRALEDVQSRPDADETLLRESFMRREIDSAVKSGIAPEKIVVVCGAYHASVLQHHVVSGNEDRWGPILSDAEIKTLPRKDCALTLMPYSYLRLSSRTGYGAGNSSPRYFGLLWEALNDKTLDRLPARFFTDMAWTMREKGIFRSPAEVIEAVALARGMAALRDETHPSLDSLRQAAITCLGQGDAARVAEALAAAEIGTEIGFLPEGVSRTAIQDDYYRELGVLRLEPYRTAVARDLILDLRENRAAKSEQSRWLDLNRSRFLHRLRVLKVSFAAENHQNQAQASWKEGWFLRWTPEAEIELVEAALLGETVEMAASNRLMESLRGAKNVADISAIIREAALCGLSPVLDAALGALQSFAVASEALGELAGGVVSLSEAVRYGDLRRIPTDPLKPLLAEMFYRSALILAESCRCNNEAARALYPHLSALNGVGRDLYQLVDDEAFVQALRDLACRDGLNPGLSGYGASLLMERAEMPEELLETLMRRRLSPGEAADVGAGWFEGLAGRNHYGLISRPRLWEILESYLDSLDDANFRRALLFLRRAFSTFSPQEKRSVCDILGELWKIDGEAVEDALHRDYAADEKDALDSLNDFDFGDL
ncbi:hypothetical protein FACS1894205_0400 [Alphaproteobacteria bacterium]|nr:hypothetical protein FACS1894205_0400 [Alphaproteobacteria bacterium]